ncbi:MAG: PorV/PorQ family protein, partial [bacterium]
KMMLKLKAKFVPLLLIVLPAGLFAQSFAKYAGEFLGIGVGSRSLGMGGAFVAVARDVTAGYWNPAGLAFIEYPEIMLMHSRQFSGALNYDYGAVGLPVGHRSSLGFGVIRLGIDDIKETDIPNPDLAVGEIFVDENGQVVRNIPFEAGTFGATDYALFMTYSKRVSEEFSYGGNVKLLNRSIGDNSAWGIGFDLGVVFSPAYNVIVGINVQDITSTMIAWDTGRKELITPSVRTGVSYPIQLSMIGGRVQPAIDFIFRFENRKESAQGHIGRMSYDVNFGWEYQYHDAFALRIGSSEFAPFTAGAGFHFPKLDIDYAFYRHVDLRNTHRISAKLTLQEPKFRRK